jgi:60 kDa SS-A/Ro ribonucleoprotein
VDIRLSPEATVFENASTLAAIPAGGTSISAPLARLNARRATGDLVLIVSDNQSWVDASRGPGTATMLEWNVFRARNPRARLVLLDLQPDTTTQVADREDVLNVGGFSDAVYDVIAGFGAGAGSSEYWGRAIDEVKIG